MKTTWDIFTQYATQNTPRKSQENPEKTVDETHLQQN